MVKKDIENYSHNQSGYHIVYRMLLDKQCGKDDHYADKIHNDHACFFEALAMMYRYHRPNGIVNMDAGPKIGWRIRIVNNLDKMRKHIVPWHNSRS